MPMWPAKWKELCQLGQQELVRRPDVLPDVGISCSATCRVWDWAEGICPARSAISRQTDQSLWDIGGSDQVISTNTEIREEAIREEFAQRGLSGST